jgi:translation initiation factor IF-2
VVAGEAGGITQHIGAYQVFRKNKLITFIDTPGHEAFTAMRSRGAKVADIAILVVAADDGVKPQTTEAYRIIEASKIPFIVAINKIDKPESDITRTKQDLSNTLGITPDDWGGKTVCIPVSAKNGTGIEDILDMVLLVAETEAVSLKANPNSSAAGTIVEARMDKGAGPVATILVHNGTLRAGDPLSFNNIFYGKVRSLKNYKGDDVSEIGPATPAKILGLKVLPEVGDLLEVAEGEKIKIKKAVAKQQAISISANEVDNENIMKLNLIIKSDVLGSAEAIEESLLKINGKKVKAKIISKGLGNISEGDIKRAEDNGAQILGFNVKIQPAAEAMVREKGVTIKSFSVIYDLIKYVQEEMQLLVKPEIKRTDLGELQVLAVFRSETSFQIIGGKVVSGVIENGCQTELVRNNRIIETGKIVSLQAGKQDVKEVSKGQECGMKYEGKPLVDIGDLLVLYKEEKIIDKI